MSANQFRLCAKLSEDLTRSLLLFAANKSEKTRQLGGKPRPRPRRRLQRARVLQRLHLSALVARAARLLPESS